MSETIHGEVWKVTGNHTPLYQHPWYINRVIALTFYCNFYYLKKICNIFWLCFFPQVLPDPPYLAACLTQCSLKELSNKQNPRRQNNLLQRQDPLQHNNSNKSIHTKMFVLVNYSWTWGLLWLTFILSLHWRKLIFPLEAKWKTVFWLGVGLCNHFPMSVLGFCVTWVFMISFFAVGVLKGFPEVNFVSWHFVEIIDHF